ncbi:alpha/beta-hydrolase [Aspergillus steynii IBT 23096]|uniref:Alpha/beta-hydrolase n=1 Tax=Aspergillus steynii IBT 23096 TaxID=1392250 RepID=A0A2I2FU10_9EURO|nr:alpha/beta-hydrolase [Aspergillus steynii IBT 23096]PLB44112.1 alpha/beta-hydrolase [Aspergillus steynii IBT 23096]
MAPVPEANIVTLLEQSALSSAGIVAYPEGDRCPPTQLSYAQLRDLVTEKAEWLRGIASFDTEARMSMLHALIRTAMLFTSARPRVLPLAPGRLKKTTLGKLSRSKIQNAMIQGKYTDQEELNERILQSYHDAHFSAPRDEMDCTLMTVFKQTIGLWDMDMGIDMPILDTGISSVDLIRLKRAVETTFGIAEIPMMTIMTNTTIRSLASALQHFKTSARAGEYQAVVTLQPHGIKTPLWFFHPGIGEILVFLALAQHFPDRPVYAMRPRGFNPGEEPFQNLDDLMTTYYTALRRQQPKGPYAMAGYSYGSVLAFEIAKKLEAEGEEVKFLGSSNLPPHIKQRMRQLGWSAGLAQISHFCNIIKEDRSREMVSELRPLPKSEQVARVLAEADPERTSALGLSQASLHTWVNVSFSLQKIGWECDPSGTVSHIDVFFCDPLRDIASSRHEYRYTKLNHWADFARNDPRFHEVDGAHYTTIMPENMPKFQRTLKNVVNALGWSGKSDNES